MGDTRFQHPYEALRAASDRGKTLRQLTDEQVVEALAAASRAADALLANVLATEASNRVRRLRAALACLGEGVIAIGREGEIRWMNPAAEKLLGEQRRDLMGEPLEDVIRHLDGKKQPVPRERCAILRAIEGESGRGDGDYFMTRGGREVCVAYTSSPLLDHDGEPEGAVLAFSDCAERKRAERELRESRERYKSLFDQSPEAIISVRLDGCIVDANPAVEKITHRPAEEVRDKPFAQFLHPDDAPRALELFDEVVAGEQQTMALRVLHKAGHYVAVEAEGIPVFVDGEVVGVHGRLRVPTDDAQAPRH